MPAGAYYLVKPKVTPLPLISMINSRLSKFRRKNLKLLIKSCRINKVIGTRGQGVRVWCPRELTTEHLTEASLRLEEPLRGFWASGFSASG